MNGFGAILAITMILCIIFSIFFSSHIISTQATLSERALELLALPDDYACLLLDIGCGSGLSGEGITETGHYWVGIDISEPMLEVALEREVEGDLILSDMGNGVPFRAGSFDGAISISALQWLCNADTKEHHPPKRLYTFFSSLYAALSRGSRAVFQFYPENSAQVELITQQAIKAGFFGGVVVDFPHSTRAKKNVSCVIYGWISSASERIRRRKCQRWSTLQRSSK